MPSLGEAFLFFKADKSDLDKGFRDAEKDAGGFVGRVGGMLGTGLKAAFAAGAVGVVGAVGGIFKGIASNADFEAFQAQFESLYGTIDGIADPVAAAKAHIDDLSKFASTTPFDLPSVIKASKTMLTFGGAALDTQENLKMVGNAAAAAGVPIDQVSTWVGKAYGAIQGGRPFGEAAAELQNMGVLSGEAREKLEAMQKAGASGPEVWAAFQESLTAPTDAMDKLGKTWGGLMSTMGDTVDGAMRTATKPLFDILKPALESILGWLNTPAVQGGIAKFGEKLGQGILFAVDAVADAVPAIQEGFRKVGQAVDVVRPYIDSLVNLLGPPIQTAFGFLSKVATDLTAAFGQGGLQGGVSNLLGTLGQISPTFQIIRAVFDSAFAPIQSIITTMFEVVSGFIATNGADITATIQNVWGQVQEIINTVIPPIQQVVSTVFGAIATFLTEHGAEIQATLTTVWQTISMAVQTALTFIQEYIVPILAAIAQFIADHSAQIQGILTGAWEMIKGIIEGAMAVIQGIVNTFMALINGDFSGAWDAIKTMFSGVWDALKGIVEGAITAISNALSIAWDLIKSALSIAWEGIKTVFSGAWTAISSTVTDTLATVSKALDDAWTTITNAFSTTWDTIKEAFIGTWNDLKKAVDDVLGPIQSAIETAWNSVSTTTTNVFNGLKTTIGNIWQGILAGLKAPINAAIDAVNGLIEGASSVGEALGFDPIPTIPRLYTGTDFFKGGLFFGGEKGPEIYKTPGGEVGVVAGGLYSAPRGTQIIPNDKAFGGAERGDLASKIGGLGASQTDRGGQAEGGIVAAIRQVMGEAMHGAVMAGVFAAAGQAPKIDQIFQVNGNPDRDAIEAMAARARQESEKVITGYIERAEALGSSGITFP